MKVEIVAGIQIAGYKDKRKVYCIERIKNGSWQISLATTPTGTIEEARDICFISLKCHELLEKFNRMQVDANFVIDLKNVFTGWNS